MVDNVSSVPQTFMNGFWLLSYHTVESLLSIFPLWNRPHCRLYVTEGKWIELGYSIYLNNVIHVDWGKIVEHNFSLFSTMRTFSIVIS